MSLLELFCAVDDFCRRRGIALATATTHLLFNDRGELLNMALTPGNVDDRKPVPRLVKRLFGKIFADKGYLSQPLFHQ